MRRKNKEKMWSVLSEGNKRWEHLEAWFNKKCDKTENYM